MHSDEHTLCVCTMADIHSGAGVGLHAVRRGAVRSCLDAADGSALGKGDYKKHLAYDTVVWSLIFVAVANAVSVFREDRIPQRYVHAALTHGVCG